jgi:hypothetical protein
MRSLITLPLLKQEFNDVDVELKWLRQTNAIRRWRAWRRFPDFQPRSLTNWDDLCYWRLTIENGNRLPAAHGAQVFTQTRLQLSDSNTLHDHIMTINGQVRKCSLSLAAQAS